MKFQLEMNHKLSKQGGWQGWGTGSVFLDAGEDVSGRKAKIGQAKACMLAVRKIVQGLASTAASMEASILFAPHRHFNV